MQFDLSQSPPVLKVFTNNSNYINNYNMVLIARVINPLTQVIKA
jgi:hypothetical protein